MSGQFVDMAPLISGLRRQMDSMSTASVVQDLDGFDRAAFVARSGYVPGGSAQAELVLAPDMALELGHPRTASVSFVLVTRGSDVRAGRVTRVGPDFDGLGSRSPHGPPRHSFAQVVCCRVSADHPPDPFDLDNAQYLTDRLPGYMVRSLPGRLWARISRAGRRAGLDLTVLAQALMIRYGELASVSAVEVFFVTSSADDVQRLALLAAEARVLSGQHKKLVLGADGAVDCTDLHCESCDERDVCEALRDVMARRRRTA